MSNDLAALVMRHLEAENSHDLAGTLATLHPQCRFDDFATGQSWFGHDGAAAHYRQWWSTFDVTVKREGDQRAVWGDGFYMAGRPGTAGISARSSASRRPAGRSRSLSSSC
jgi:hypothetical protein